MKKSFKNFWVCFNCALLLSTLCSACDDDHSTKTMNQQPNETVAGTNVTTEDMLEAGQEEPAGQEEMNAGVATTRPPILAGTESEDNRLDTWIEIGLDAFGLVTPEDSENEGLPLGESLCAYQAPEFVLEHPFAQGTQEGRSGYELHNQSYEPPSAYHLPVATIAHLEPNSPTVVQVGTQAKPDLDGLVLPSHVNDIPLYERAQDWSGERCYELGPFANQENVQQGGTLLNQAAAYEMYVRLIRTTLWRNVDQTPEHRTVIGLRGAYPGSLQWHYNAPNQYNDTIVLLWKDAQGQPHVYEYPVNTDTGVYDFGTDNSSSLRANRHYPYINGWHRDYNALQINLPGYPVRDDTNNNGHWDSDRNGWLDGPEEGADYDRLGTAHNIHAGDHNGPVEEAVINIASAGCQVIPGMENWMHFIGHAWTAPGDDVDYYLVDTRDISPRFYNACASADGSHHCPHLIQNFPYQHQGDTSLSLEKQYDLYNCSSANEGGAEVVYVVNLPSSGQLRIQVETADDSIDPDIYLLEGDDAQACRVRDHRSINTWVPEGRYVIIVDTWVNDEGRELSGPYELSIDWSPEL